MLGEIFDAVAACGMAALPRLATSNGVLTFEDADTKGEPLIFATTLFLDAEEASSLRAPAMPLWCDLPSPARFPPSFFTALDDDDDVLDNVRTFDIPLWWHTLDDVDAMAFDDSLSNSSTAPAARFVAQRRIVALLFLYLCVLPLRAAVVRSVDVWSRAHNHTQHGFARGDLMMIFVGIVCTLFLEMKSPPRLRLYDVSFAKK